MQVPSHLIIMKSVGHVQAQLMFPFLDEDLAVYEVEQKQKTCGIITSSTCGPARCLSCSLKHVHRRASLRFEPFSVFD